MLTLEQWLTKIENNNPGIKLGLNNIRLAAEKLHLPKPAPYVITVAGTNGKGSVCRLLEKLFTAHGLRTGCYTSPHLIDFNERICINSQPVTNDQIVAGFEYIENILESSISNLTFFEFTTLAAWYIFANNNLDILILEIGLGGRLDAVNVIPKDVAVITSIDYDHQQFLGETLEQIGFEKAGIITDKIPVILGDKIMPESIYDIAQQQTESDKIYQYEKDFSLYTKNNGQCCFTIRALDQDKAEWDFVLNHSANIRFNNIATALMVIKVASQHYKCFEPTIIKSVLANFNVLGRCSWIDANNSLLLDVAHNQQSIRHLADFIQEFKKNNGNKKVIALCGMLADKDITNSLASINPLIDEWHLISINNSRGEQAVELAKIVSCNNPSVKYKLYNNINTSFKLVYNFITQKINNDCILVIFGSFYIVGPIYKYIISLKDSNKLWKFS